jgi:glycosyltransferase involved in cell wall biosynthesis
MSLRIAAFSAVDLSLPQGHALHLRGLLDALAARGHEVVLVTPRPSGAMPSTRFHVVPVAFLPWRVLGPWTFELLGGLRLLVVAHRLRAHAIYARQDLYTCAPAIAAALLRKPLVAEVNASIPDEMALWERGAVQSLARRSERRMLSRARAIVTLADGLTEILASRTGVPRDRFHVVPIATHLPAPVDVVRERTALGVPADRFVVAFAGNLRPVQGVETLIDAARRLHADASVGPDGIELWIIGTGSIEQALRERASGALVGSPASGAPEHRARMPEIRFFGGVPREESDRLLSCAQILVAPYCTDAYDRIAGDAISTKVLTYLAADRPVLVSDLPYYRWIEERGAGECVPSNDPVALAGSIEDWRARWIRDGRPLVDWPWPAPGPGRRYVESGRTWDDAAGKVEKVLRSLTL